MLRKKFRALARAIPRRKPARNWWKWGFSGLLVLLTIAFAADAYANLREIEGETTDTPS